MLLTEDVVGMCRIESDPALLKEELSEHPATYAYLAMLQAEATFEVGQLKREEELLFAQLYTPLRERKEAGEKGLTEKAIETIIEMNDAMQTAQHKRADGEKILQQLQGLTEAYRQRRDLLVQLCRATFVSGEGAIVGTSIADRARDAVAARREHASTTEADSHKAAETRGIKRAGVVAKRRESSPGGN